MGPEPSPCGETKNFAWFRGLRITANLAQPLPAQGSGFNSEVETYRHLVAVKPLKDRKSTLVQFVHRRVGNVQYRAIQNGPPEVNSPDKRRRYFLWQPQ